MLRKQKLFLYNGSWETDDDDGPLVRVINVISFSTLLTKLEMLTREPRYDAANV